MTKGKRKGKKSKLNAKDRFYADYGHLIENYANRGKNKVLFICHKHEMS
jgi:hypothetical protein